MRFKKIIISIMLFAFVFLILPAKNFCASGVSSYKKYGWPLIGVSILAGVGANYLRKEALKRYDKAEEIWEEYMNIPKDSSYETFESAYEKYEDKYAEAIQYRNYYLICGGAAILTAAAGIFLVLYSPSNKSISIGWTPDFYSMQNSLHLRVKF